MVECYCVLKIGLDPVTREEGREVERDAFSDTSEDRSYQFKRDSSHFYCKALFGGKYALFFESKYGFASWHEATFAYIPSTHHPYTPANSPPITTPRLSFCKTPQGRSARSTLLSSDFVTCQRGARLLTHLPQDTLALRPQPSSKAATTPAQSFPRPTSSARALSHENNEAGAKT